MSRIKRVKGGVTAWATGVAKQGNVTGLTANPAQAAEVTPEQAAAAEAHYRTRPIFGVLEVVGRVKEPEKQKPAAVVADVQPKPTTEAKPSTAPSHGSKQTGS